MNIFPWLLLNVSLQLQLNFRQIAVSKLYHILTRIIWKTSILTWAEMEYSPGAPVAPTGPAGPTCPVAPVAPGGPAPPAVSRKLVNNLVRLRC